MRHFYGFVDVQHTFYIPKEFRNSLSDKIKRYVSFLLFYDQEGVLALLTKGVSNQIIAPLVVKLTSINMQ